jgi:SAM-dependent methyltransferase
MSKGADDETSDMEEGMTTAERRRRRRRGAGLRIPSDNVPRQARTGPVNTPVPEDPSLAMSIAYAFTDDASGPNRVVDVNGLDDLDDATSIAQAPDVKPDGSTPGAPDQVVDDVVPDGRTRQMAAVSLEALGLTSLEEELASGNGASPETVDVDLDDVSSDGDDFGESEINIQRRPATIPPPLPMAATSKPMDAMREGRVDDAKERAITDVDERAEARRSAQREVERSDTDRDRSVDRTGDRAADKSADRSADRTSDKTGDKSVDRTADRSGERSPIADRTTERNVRVEAGDGVVAGRVPRAATVALSEDDLEELLEVTPPPQRIPQPPATAGATAAPVAVQMPSAAPDAPVSGNSTGAEVALADDDIQEVATPSSAGDSGEILADEIVEVEQESRAPAVPTSAVTSAPPPAPASSQKLPSQGAAPPSPPKAAPPAPAKKSTAAKHAAAASAAALPGDTESRKKRRGKPWFEEVFDEDYLRTLPFLTPQATQAEALMAIDGLGIQPGASVLDVGCGYGRHAMELAARGFHVVGVDLSLPLLLRGADEAQRRGLDINFVHADMREMDFDQQFDGAYCLFSTFGYFDDETNKKVATLIGKALKPGGKLILEMLNRDYVIGDLPARVWWEGDGCVVLEEVEFNYFSSRVQSKRSVVFDDGRQVEQEISVRVYSLHEVGKMLHAAGLRVLEVSGGMAARGRFLGNRSREIIVVAERRPADKS